MRDLSKIGLIEDIRYELSEEFHKEIEDIIKNPSKSVHLERVTYKKSLDIFDEVLMKVLDNKILEGD